VSSPVALAVNTGAPTCTWSLEPLPPRLRSMLCPRARSARRFLSRSLCRACDGSRRNYVWPTPAPVTGNGVYVATDDQTPASAMSSASPWERAGARGNQQQPLPGGGQAKRYRVRPTDSYVYVTDISSNHLIGYTIMKR